MIDLILRYVIPYLIMFVVSFAISGIIWNKKLKKDKSTNYIGVMDLILILEGIAILAYVIVDFIVFWHTGNEPSTLTVSFFAVCGGENGVMAWIKVRKEQERLRKWQKEDEGEEYHADKGL